MFGCDEVCSQFCGKLRDMTNRLTEAYELLEKLLDEEKVYLDRGLDFRRLCTWLKVQPQLMDELLIRELGIDGEGLISSLRGGERERLKRLYNIDTDF